MFTYAFVSVSRGYDTQLVNTCNCCFFRGGFFLFLDFANDYIPPTYIKAFIFLFYVCFLSLFHLEMMQNWLILAIIVSFRGGFFLFLYFTNDFIPATYIKAFTFLFYVCFLSLFHLEKIHNWLILTIIVSFRGGFFLFLYFMNDFIPATYIKAFTFLFYVCFLSLFHLEKIHNWLILAIIVSFRGGFFLFLYFTNDFIPATYIKAFTFLFYVCFCLCFIWKRYTIG